jgi:hypothetical protein
MGDFSDLVIALASQEGIRFCFLDVEVRHRHLGEKGLKPHT